MNGTPADQTTYRLCREEQTVHVRFDLREEEGCFIELPFCMDDLLAVRNMECLRQNIIGLSGAQLDCASLGAGSPAERCICLSYLSGRVGFGTVVYPYRRLAALLDRAHGEFADDPEDL